MTEGSGQNDKGTLRGQAASFNDAELPAWLVEMLICPVDGGSVQAREAELVCQRCGRCYPVRDGIPNMVVEDTGKEHKF